MTIEVETVKVLVVEPNGPLRETIKWVLVANKSCCVVGEANDLEEATTRVAQLQPHVVLVDVSAIPDGMAALRSLASDFPQTRAVALLSYYSDEYRALAHASGAFACVAKEHLEEHLAWVLEKALATRGQERLTK